MEIHNTNNHISTENLALELYKKSTKIKHVSAKIKAIENALEILNEDERAIITMKYLESQPWYVIAYKVQYSESQSKRIRRRAIRKICVALFGEEDDPNMTRFDKYLAV